MSEIKATYKKDFRLDWKWRIERYKGQMRRMGKKTPTTKIT